MKAKFALLAILLVSAAACGSQATSQATPQATETVSLPTPTATSTPDYSGPCTNVLFPFLPDRQWVYQKRGMDETVTPDPLTSRFGLTVAGVNDSQALLRAVDLGSGATTETFAECQEGAITNFPLMTLGSLFGNYLAGDIQVQYVSGLFAPSASALEASGWNMSWQGEYIASGTVTFSVEGDQTTVLLSDSPVTLRWQNAGQETVTVPAGTFENAYRVNRTAQIQASITIEGLTGRATITIETVHWFAPYVGLLKSEVVSGSLTTFGITFPLEVSGSIELVEAR
ncbi:MAG: hypothetical protein ABWK53_00530 [Anaerolineales bacterium]